MTSLINNGGTSLINNPITYTAIGLPAGMTLTLAGNLVGTPTTSGSGTITVTASDGYATATSNTTYTVSGSVSGDGSWTNVTMLINGENASSWQANSLFTDLSSNGLALTQTGTVTQGSFSPFGNDWSVYFGSSSSNQISTPVNSLLNIGTGTNLTIEFWVNFNSFSNTPYIFTSQWSMYVNPTGTVHVTTGGTTTSTLSPNVWYHMAITRTSANLWNFYINGTAALTAWTDASNYNNGGSNNNFVIGNFTGNYVQGYISNFRFVQGTVVYTGTFTPPTSPLTAISGTQLLTCQSNSFVDNSPNKFALTISGNPAVQKLSPFVPSSSYASGLPTATSINWSNYFNGTSSYITGPTGSATQFSGAFTVECWIYFSSFASEPEIFDNRVSANNNGFIWQVLPSGAINITNASAFSLSTTNTIIVNTWNHVAVTRNSSNVINIWINGVNSASNISSINMSDGAITIGNNSARGTSEIPNGYISNFRVNNTTAVYTTNFNVPTSPLTAIAGTSLLTCQSNAINDNSVNNLALTNVGSVLVEQNGPFNGGMYSNYFNGTSAYFTTTSTTFGELGSTFTIEAWVNLFSYAVNPRIIAVNNTANALDFFVGGSASTFPGSLAFGWTSGDVGCHTTSTIPLNTWTHVAVVVNSGVVAMYVNGVSQTLSGTTTGYNFTTSGATSIGACPAVGTSYNWTGYISNLRVNTSVVYPSNFTPPTSPLAAIAGTTLLTCQSGNFIDNGPLSTALTVTGSPTIQQYNPFVNTTVATTPVTYSNSFNGSTSWLVGPSSTAFQLTNNFTVECWVYALSPSSSQEFVNYYHYTNGGQEQGWHLDMTGGAFRFRNAYGSSSISGGTVVANAWTHVAGVMNGGTAYLYVNGSQVATGNIGLPGGYSSCTVGIGYYNLTNFTNSNFFNGNISNVRINNTTAIYTTNFTPPTSPLTAISGTILLTCQSSTFIDNSTNNFSLTNTGNVGISYNNPFASTYSNYFTSASSLVVPYSSNFNLTTQNFTIEFWISFTTLPSSSNGFFPVSTVTNDNTGTGNGFGIALYSNNIYLVGNNNSQGIYPWTPIVNTWYHIALCRTSTSSATLYLNGVAITGSGNGAGNPTFPSNTTQPLYIGGASSSGSTGSAYIYNLRINNGNALYTSNFTPNFLPYTAVSGTVLLTCQSNHFVDNSGNNYSITNGTAGTSISQIVPPVLNSYYLPITYSTPINYSNYFDGSTGYLSCVAGTAVEFSGNFTIEGWFFPTAYGGQVIDMGQNNNVGIGGIAISSGNTFVYFGSSYVSAPALTLNTWNHLAVVRSGTTLTVYINGTSSASATVTATSYSSTGHLCIGAMTVNSNYTSPVSFYSGYVSNVRIVNGTAVYTSNFIPSTTALTAITGTTVLTCQSNVFADNSVNNLPLTKNGKVVVRQDFQPFGTNWSNYFNGSSYITGPTSNAAYMFAGDFTIEGWFSNTGGGAAVYIFDTGASGNHAGIAASYDSGGLLSFEHNTGTVTSTSHLTQGSGFHHIAVVRHSGTIVMYLDGVSICSVSDSVNLNYGSFALGGTITGGDLFTGYVTNFRVNNTTAIYTSNFTVPTSALTAITGTSLLTCQSNNFVDTSTNALTLTPTGSTQVSNATPFTNSYPLVGTSTGSIYFNGVNGYYLSGPTSAATQFPGNFTVECWYYTTITASGGFIDTRTSSGSSTGFAFEINSGSYVVASAGATYLSGGVVVANTWTHVALVRNGTTLTLYVNGTSIATGTTSVNFSDGGLLIGNNKYSTNYTINGYISNFRVVGSAVYTSNFVPSTSPLLPIQNTTLLLAGTNTGIIDQTGLNDLITVGGCKISTSISKYGTGSLSFDGSTGYAYAPSSSLYQFGGNFTIEFWIYPINFNSTPVLFDNRAANASSTGIYMYCASNGTLNVTGASVSSSTVIPSGQWSHIALVRNGTTIGLYLNGTNVGTASNVSTYFSDGHCVIGAYTFSSISNYLNGYMDDFRITNGVARYTSNFTPPTALPTI